MLTSGRQKLKTFISRIATIAAASLWMAALPAAEPQKLAIRADRPGETISRFLYGHFAEHLGRGVYGGIWVGNDSDIPNTRGYRNDVVSALRDLEIPVIRWPGGCFADEYDWRDGIGPQDQRPVRINTHWGWVEESNAFGTHEFMELVELLGSEAYIAGNIGSGTPREMAQWLEYMTAEGDTELAKLRRANGRDRPWEVAFFGVGNETWGCGGNMTPEYYAHLYNRYATFLKAPEGQRPKRIASGGSNEETEWTQALASAARTGLDGISHHHYTIPTGNWDRKGSATGFPEREWISTLHNTLNVDGFLSLNEAVLDQYDPAGKIGIYLDEWGTWYDPDPAGTPGMLYQQNTLRDALVAALNFNVFHQHAKRLHMANIAQTVNVLQSVILTDGDQMVRTPTYHVFWMYKPFKDAVYVPIEFHGLGKYTLDDVSIPAVSASAALSSAGGLVLALVNPDPANSVAVTADLVGHDARKGAGHVLTAAAMDAYNTFDEPRNVRPSEIEVEIVEGRLNIDLPPKSVTVIELD